MSDTRPSKKRYQRVPVDIMPEHFAKGLRNDPWNNPLSLALKAKGFQQACLGDKGGGTFILVSGKEVCFELNDQGRMLMHFWNKGCYFDASAHCSLDIYLPLPQ